MFFGISFEQAISLWDSIGRKKYTGSIEVSLRLASLPGMLGMVDICTNRTSYYLRTQLKQGIMHPARLKKLFFSFVQKLLGIQGTTTISKEQQSSNVKSPTQTYRCSGYDIDAV